MSEEVAVACSFLRACDVIIKRPHQQFTTRLAERGAADKDRNIACAFHQQCRSESTRASVEAPVLCAVCCGRWCRPLSVATQYQRPPTSHFSLPTTTQAIRGIIKLKRNPQPRFALRLEHRPRSPQLTAFQFAEFVGVRSEWIACTPPCPKLGSKAVPPTSQPWLLSLLAHRTTLPFPIRRIG